MKKVITGIIAVLLILLSVLIANTLALKSKQIPKEKDLSIEINIEGSVERLSKSITFQTVSYDDTAQIDYSSFLAFHEYLKQSFPAVFSNLGLEMVGTYTIVLKWVGKDTSLPPAIFMAHQDVVPVSDDTKAMWTVPAFDGMIRDGIIYGRGVIDDKINLMAQLETAEHLLKQGFSPERTIYFVFGHDEEIGGNAGAAQVAKLFEQRGIKALFVLDEGGIVTYEKVPGMEKAVALVGTSEKGGITLELTVDIPGGHSSFPGKETAIDVLSKALVNLRSKPFAPAFSPSVQDFIAYTAPEMPFGQRLVMANQWIFKPLIYRIYSSTPIGDAMIRTTMVPTIINSGVKSNVIPTIAKAKVNYRILPGNTIEGVIEHTRNAINDDRVNIDVMPVPREATAASSPDSAGFQMLMQPLKHHFDDAVVSPFLMIGGTDSRHFSKVTPNIYKFSPMIDPIGFHGVDEQLKVSDYGKAINFYYSLIKSL